ncbi:MAG: TlpA disulfide reductase family protein [Paludibacter sp.]|nr:TlpA disulfide reductase family protein [Paludibacter sp.]
MKKISISLLLCLLILNSYSQKIIENPYFSATTAPYVKITKIELSDTATIMSFDVTFFPKWSISLSSKKTYIQDSKGGEKLYVKRAEGIELDKKITSSVTGRNIYKLFFPPLNKNTTLIDYMEDQWKIFDIEVVHQQHFSIVPQELKGNWLRTDGSNDWIIGVYDNMIIYENEVWNKVFIERNKKVYKLLLQQNNKTRNLIIKKAKNNNIFIGTDTKNLNLLSRNTTFKKNYIIENDSDFKLPVFHKDTFVFKGYIKGYHPKMGKTGMIYIDDIINQEQNSNLVTINPDGTFLVKCFMIHPQVVLIRILGIKDAIFAEPGKTLFYFADISEYTTAFKTLTDYKKRKRKSLFMGDNARVNADLKSTDTIDYYDDDKLQKQLPDMDGNQYKSYCLEIMQKELAQLKEYIAYNSICKKALTIKEFEIPYRTYENILSFNGKKQYAYRKKNNVPREQREIPLKSESFQPEYYNFINSSDLNNPVSLVCGAAYNSLINRIQYSDCVRQQPAINYTFKVFSDSLNSKAIKLTSEENLLLNKLKICNSVDSMNMFIKQDSATWKKLVTQHMNLINSISRNAFTDTNDKNFKKYFGLEAGLAKEIMYSQTRCSKLKGTFKPFSDEEMEEIKQKVQTKFIVDYLMELSKVKEIEIAKKLVANKKKSDFQMNETPKTEADKLFDAIIQKYKGKVIFVDFWATWCSPCRSGIENMKPLKEEFKDKDLVFLYITDESSPIDTWNMLIPDIKGEHYRVKKDEWNYFKSKFKIGGIPHYALVNKIGEIVRDHIYFASSSNELKILFNEYLK